MTTNDYTYPIGSFLLGLSKQDAGKLFDDEREVMQDNIGSLAKREEAVCTSIAHNDLGILNKECLMLTASLLNNLIGEINSLLQV
jgi:hypothetical protein